MKEALSEIRNYLAEKEKIKGLELKVLLSNFLNIHLKGLHIENYIGDYPTFMEPVYLGDNVKIGDDVLIGPNVFIGENSKIGDYVEISNTIVFENVKLGSNVKLENVIIDQGSLVSDNLKEKNCVLFGLVDSKLDKITF